MRLVPSLSVGLGVRQSRARQPGFVCLHVRSPGGGCGVRLHGGQVGVALLSQQDVNFRPLLSLSLSLSDCRRYGRRFAMLLSIAIQAVFGVAAAFAPNFPVYVVLRFVVGSTISGVIMSAFVLGTDRHVFLKKTKMNGNALPLCFALKFRV